MDSNHTCLEGTSSDFHLNKAEIHFPQVFLKD